MAHAFISYSHQDQDFISELEPTLEEAGFEVWTDQELLAGENWKQRIDDAIEGAFALVVFMTPAAKSSEYVTYEWSYALGVGVTVIPVMLRQTGLHPKLGDLQYLDFTEDITTPLKKLVQRLKALEIQHLIKQLKHSRHRVRLSAIKRLAELKAGKAVDALIWTMQHDRSQKAVRPAAAQALETIGSKKALAAVKAWRGD